MVQGRKNITLYINIEFTQMLKKNYLNLRNTFHAGKCFPAHKTLCLPLKNLNDDFQFSKPSVKRDLENELMVAEGDGRVRSL